jgi:carbonic anhydrase
LEKLINGLHSFQQNYFRDQRPLFERLAKGQSPEALFITCSDSRIDPNLITQAQPGDLFIIRNAGNLIPPYGAMDGGNVASIEYAVAALKVKDIIVCGHSHCGAMGAILDPDSLEGLPAMRKWLDNAAATRRIMAENYPDLDESRRLLTTVEENVLVQIENLRTHPSVAARLGRNDLKLHAWVYKIESGEVFHYNPQEGQFQAFADNRAHVSSAT